jgi:Tol biopolymer transport system component
MATIIRNSGRADSQVCCVVLALCAALAACAGAGTRQTARSASARTVAVTAAQLFAPGTISDAREQWRITFSRDGSVAYFAASDEFFPFSRKATIYVSRFSGFGDTSAPDTANRWEKPDTAVFSGKYSDIDPAISPDGRRLYFSSIRPVNGIVRGDLDIWMVEQTGRGWSDPIHLGPEVNTPLDELYPSVSRDGSLYFASGPPAPAAGQHWDIFRAARRGAGFFERERLGEAVNRAPQPGDPHPQAAWDFNPEISADGTMLVFTSLRPDGRGLGDLYVSHLIRGKWSPAVNLGPSVNTTADEYHPTLSPDGAWLYFVRRQPRAGDFHRIPVRLIPELIQSRTRGLRDASLR